MSETVDQLTGGQNIAWAALKPAFTHAIALAKEAEYQAGRASNESQSYVRPAYPPLVELLAQSAEVPF